MSKRPEIIVMSGELSGKRFAIPDAGLRLGRSSSNDLHLPDEELSRNHCLFEANGEDGISVIDLASANGTFVNGVQLGASAHPLKVGDVVEVGSTRLQVVAEGQSAPAPAAAAAAPAPVARPAGAVDLGLGGAKAEAGGSAPGAAPVDPQTAQKRKVVNLICAAAATVLVVAIVVLMTNGKMMRGMFAKKVVEEKEAAPVACPICLTYERVEATTDRIVRYQAVVEGAEIDLSYEVRSLDQGEEQRVARKGSMSKSTEDRLVGIFSDPAWRDVESVSGGSAEAMNSLRSWRLNLARDGVVKEVVVENTVLAGLFKDFCLAFETGVNNDLQVTVSLRSAKECLAASHEHEAIGDDLVEHADVHKENLWKGLNSLRMARHDLEGLTGFYEDLTRLQKKIEAADASLTERYNEFNSKAEQSCQIGAWSDALEAYREICALIPDTTDERGAKAEEQILYCERQMSEANKKGKR